jgi:hypothetical protein
MNQFVQFSDILQEAQMCLLIGLLTITSMRAIAFWAIFRQL